MSPNGPPAPIEESTSAVIAGSTQRVPPWCRPCYRTERVGNDAVDAKQPRKDSSARRCQAGTGASVVGENLLREADLTDQRLPGIGIPERSQTVGNAVAERPEPLQRHDAIALAPTQVDPDVSVEVAEDTKASVRDQSRPLERQCRVSLSWMILWQALLDACAKFARHQFWSCLVNRIGVLGGRRSGDRKDARQHLRQHARAIVVRSHPWNEKTTTAALSPASSTRRPTAESHAT